MKPSRQLRLEETAEEGADRLGQDGGPARRVHAAPIRVP
jgi:hypothetical protein